MASSNSPASSSVERLAALQAQRQQERGHQQERGQQHYLRAQPRAQQREPFLLPELQPWPTLPDAAMHGLAGRYVRKLEPHTEADPAAVLVQFLVMYGNAIGHRAHFRVEADRHYFNLFAVLVGKSSKGRKGVSAGQAKRLLRVADEHWSQKRFEQGMSSGEGLIWSVRDPVERTEAVREQGKPTGQVRSVVSDGGVEDKRLLVLEPEFAATLRVLKRDGNTLSATIRNAWDHGRLSSLTKNSPARATGAHISIIGHITKGELLRYLETVETGNGFGNRFLWCCVRRSKCLPEGGRTNELDFRAEQHELNQRLDFGRRTGEMRRSAEARRLWAEVYPELSAGKPGLLGAMLGRAEAQTMRLACVYALLDGSAVVDAVHLAAALGLWGYCEGSTRWIFGDGVGEPLADEILRLLRDHPNGLTKGDIGDHFHRHRSKTQLGRALALLLEHGLVTRTKEPTGGRPLERWRAMSRLGEGSERSEGSEESGETP